MQNYCIDNRYSFEIEKLLSKKVKIFKRKFHNELL